MKIYHITTRERARSILKQGLRLEHSNADLWPRLWFWNIHHLGSKMERMAYDKRCRIDQLAILEVEISFRAVRFNEGGEYYVEHDIPAHDIRLYYDMAYLSSK